MGELNEMAGGPGFRNRKTGLVVFGVVEIVLGALCAMAVSMVILAMVMASTLAQDSGAQVSARSLLFGVFLYGLMAAFCVTMGIGSIRARRWARALILVVSSLWLVFGVATLLTMAFAMPRMFDTIAQRGQMPAGVATAVKTISLAFMTIFYVIVPATFVLFYRSPHVKATCDRLDPVPRWTDRCPLPVLALVLIFGYSTCFMPAIGFYNWATPFFGRILTGATGAAVVLTCAAVWAWITWGLFHLKAAAWWTAILMTLLWCTSAGVTFSRTGILDLYAQMGLPPEQLEQLEPFLADEKLLAGAMVGWVAAFLGYMIFTKRFFSRPTAGPA